MLVHETNRTNHILKWRTSRQRTTIVNGKNIPRVQNLEIHATHSCNLVCESCSHYSNQHHKGIISPEAAKEWMLPWVDRLQPDKFGILGGEPLLNKRLPEFIEVCQECWKKSQLVLVTNGFLANRFNDDLPQALAKAKVKVNVSIHHNSSEYINRLQEQEPIFERWHKHFGIEIQYRQSVTPTTNTTEGWTRRYHGHGVNCRPYNDNNPRKSWVNCAAKGCLQLFEGKLWKCPATAYLQMQCDKYQIHKHWQPYLNYQGLSSSCSNHELIKWLKKEDEEVCGMCPAHPPLIQLNNPIP